MQVFYPYRIGIWSFGFCRGRKTGEPREKPSEQGENQQQTQPTYCTRRETNPEHIGGRRELSPLRHPCSPIFLPMFIRKLCDTCFAVFSEAYELGAVLLSRAL